MYKYSLLWRGVTSNLKKSIQFNSAALIFLAAILLSVIVPPVQSSVLAADAQYGIALKNPTNIYSKKSRGASVIRTYEKGTILKYRQGSGDWHQAVVYVNGKWQDGFIYKHDVETSTASPVTKKGVALQSSTKVFSSASTSASSWKSYPAGSILKYRTFTANWYEATVYVKGKKKTGYIYRTHVENAAEKPDTLTGVALKSPTAVYSNASTGKSLKTYAKGSILKYRTFTSNWYEATVYVNGKKHTGYIRSADVDNAVSDQTRIEGIGLQNPTTVYAAASTSSKKLKSYAAGTVLIYQTFASDWYQAKVYVSGKATTGYIHASHVEGIYETQKRLNGRALKKPTNVYANASRQAKVLKSYAQHSNLIFKTLSPTWFEATVYINGVATKGYIHTDDVTTGDVVHTNKYSYDLKHMVDSQMKVSPQTDLTGGKGWQHASRNQVEYYTNPTNFKKGSQEYFQFLVLSHLAGLDANETNQKFLSNKGVLTNKASVFIDGAKKHNVNEVYLIAHSLLETGNGTSALAKGISSWTKRDASGNIVKDKNGKPITMNIAPQKVYNVYGIGAFDKCARDCGAQRAYDNGWFSVDTAIREGAAFVSTGYLDRGQDTIYKMRWNPDHLRNASTGYHQYATDVGWAVKQTKTIYNMYQSLSGNYTLVFDVPQYVNQNNAPKGSKDWQGVAPAIFIPGLLQDMEDEQQDEMLEESKDTNHVDDDMQKDAKEENNTPSDVTEDDSATETDQETEEDADQDEVDSDVDQETEADTDEDQADEEDAEADTEQEADDEMDTDEEADVDDEQDVNDEVDTDDEQNADEEADTENDQNVDGETDKEGDQDAEEEANSDTPDEDVDVDEEDVSSPDTTEEIMYPDYVSGIVHGEEAITMVDSADIDTAKRLTEIPSEAVLDIIGEIRNTEDEPETLRYLVSFEDKTGYVDRKDIQVTNLLEFETEQLLIYAEPDRNADVVVHLQTEEKTQFVAAVADEENQWITSDDWIQVYIDEDHTGWVNRNDHLIEIE